MTQVMVEAYEMVEEGYLTEDDFRDLPLAMWWQCIRA
jgi:hypothetical protein